MYSRNLFNKALIIAATTFVFAPLHAQNVDSNDPIKIVVGYAPGGALDIMARSLADEIREISGAPVIVENKPGAGTRIAIANVKKAKPDGRTILLGPQAPFTVVPFIYKDLNYDFDQDFIPVAQLADVPLSVSVGVNQPYQSLKEYTEWRKQNPTMSGVGVTGLGGPSHMSILRFGKDNELEVTPIAYQGGAPLFSDVAAGHVPIGLDAIGGAIAFHQNKRIKIVAVSGDERFPALPDVPTLKEIGFPSLNFRVWYGALVPAGTPKNTVDKLEKLLISAVQAPEFRKKMELAGVVLTGFPGERVAADVHSERKTWKPVVEESGFKAEN